MSSNLWRIDSLDVLTARNEEKNSSNVKNVKFRCVENVVRRKFKSKYDFVFWFDFLLFSSCLKYLGLCIIIQNVRI